MKIFDVEQLSPEWWDLKKGRPSASNFDRIITAKTMKLSAQADDYIAELVADVVCQCPPYFTSQGRPINSYAVQNGIDTEPQARRWYELQHDVEVRQVGLCMTDDERFCCSPDGLVGEAGGLELKCPLMKTHATYLMDPNKLLMDYRAQVHGALIVTGRAWWELCSYANGLPPLLLKVEPDKFTDELRVQLELFWDNYQSALERFRKL